MANILVLLVFKSDVKLLKRTPANNLLLSLAINDLMTGLISLLQLLPFIISRMFHDDGMKKLHYRISLDISITLLSMNSVMHLCLLAAERYLSIFYALQFKGMVTTRRVRYCILLAWLISVLIASCPFAWQWPLFSPSTTIQKRRSIQKIDTYYSAITVVAFALVPLVLLSIAYVRMFIMCKKLIREAPDNLLARKKTVNKELKILLMYFVMYLVFIVLCVPFFSVRLTIDVHHFLGKIGFIQLPEELVETFLLARFLASGVNPFIYTFYKQDFRRAVRTSCLFRMFCQECCRKRLGRNGESSTRDVYASFGTQLTTIRKSGSEIGLSDLSPNSKPLLGNRDNQQTSGKQNQNSNGMKRLMVQEPTRF